MQNTKYKIQNGIDTPIINDQMDGGIDTPSINNSDGGWNRYSNY